MSPSCPQERPSGRLEGCNGQHLRTPRLFEELRLAHADGRYPKLMAGFPKTDLLVLDDWGLAPLADADRHEMLEILEDRHEVRAAMLTSQLPVDA